ncbi:MAG: TIGR03668 family PPOX class F420-dependent oxidoreductase [Candidatus Dormibacteraceae bacterium]
MTRLLADARVGHLATTRPDGKPHLVPVCFVLDGGVMYFAVDAKPKRTADLRRLRNIAANPSVSVLVDHYEEDWARLWWVRVDGRARTVDDAIESERALNLLGDRYPQYLRARPPGPVVAITIERMSGWAGS